MVGTDPGAGIRTLLTDQESALNAGHPLLARIRTELTAAETKEKAARAEAPKTVERDGSIFAQDPDDHAADKVTCSGVDPAMIVVEFIENHLSPDGEHRPDRSVTNGDSRERGCVIARRNSLQARVRVRRRRPGGWQAELRAMRFF
jgi:hypothetical protein